MRNKEKKRAFYRILSENTNLNCLQLIRENPIILFVVSTRCDGVLINDLDT